MASSRKALVTGICLIGEVVDFVMMACDGPLGFRNHKRQAHATALLAGYVSPPFAAFAFPSSKQLGHNRLQGLQAWVIATVIHERSACTAADIPKIVEETKFVRCAHPADAAGEGDISRIHL